MSDIIITSKKLVKVPIKDLHVQYVPVVTPLDIWNYDMSIVNSPHVGLIESIKKVGISWPALKNTRYVKVREHRRKCGLYKWTTEKIMDHIKVRWSIYNSIRKNGFKSSKCKSKPVIVLRVPFWESRFGYKADWHKGLQIWDGAGRTTAMHCCGRDYVHAMFAEDAKPGTGDRGHFEKKLANVKDMKWQF